MERNNGASSSKTLKRRKMDTCADEQEETNRFYKLFGRNEVPYVELWGWTNSIVMGFPELRSDLKMSELLLPPGKGKELPADIQLLQSIGEKLESLAKGDFRNEYMTILCPLFVQVVAKKKVDIVMLKERKESSESEPKTTLVIGNLIVADDTGACLLTMFNEATSLVHEKVQVGDTLVIKKGSFKNMNKESLKLDYPFQKSLLNLEIKIDKYQVRQIIHIPVQKDWPHRLHPCLFPQEANIMGPRLPSAVLAEIEEKLKNTEKLADPMKKEVFFDLQGIISYTGRVERVQVHQSDVIYLRDPVKSRESDGIEKLDGTQDKINCRQFVAFRYLEIVDLSSKPLLVKVFLKKDNLEMQPKLVPGAMVLLTHCKMSVCEYLEDFVSTSVFSNIYCNDELRTYLTVMPERYLKLISENISFETCQEIYKRIDIKWGACGTIRPKIKSPNKFLSYYNKGNNENGNKRILKQFPKGWGGPRETLTVFFRGKIITVQLITEESSLIGYHEEVLGSRQNARDLRKLDQGWKNENSEFFAKSNESTFIKRFERINWIFSRRIIPQFDVPAEEVKKARDLAVQVTKVPEKLCESLLMPPVTSCDSAEEIPELGKCPRREGFPFYRVTIRDEENQQWYEAVWDAEPFEIMRQKWMDAQDRVIVGLMDIHSFGRGKNYGWNVSLRDFVIEDEVKFE